MYTVVVSDRSYHLPPDRARAILDYLFDADIRDHMDPHKRNIEVHRMVCEAAHIGRFRPSSSFRGQPGYRLAMVSVALHMDGKPIYRSGTGFVCGQCLSQAAKGPKCPQCGFERPANYTGCR